MPKKFGDRFDGKLLRELDALHFLMPLIYPNRADNEAFISERIDCTNIEKYLEKKNADNPEYKYTLFQVVLVAYLKCIMLRPKLNRFVANGNYYQRNYISASFIVKKIFSDEGGEGLAFVYAENGDNINSIHDKIFKIVSACRGGEKSATDDGMDIFNKMPRFLAKAIMRFVRMLDRHGKIPKTLVENDPNYASIFISNLGSIKLKSGYHHLSNWGTTSLFSIIGQKKMRPFYNDDGTFEMKMSVDLGLTIDERIADGYYYSKTIRLLKALLENPELLELPLDSEVDY